VETRADEFSGLKIDILTSVAFGFEDRDRGKIVAAASVRYEVVASNRTNKNRLILQVNAARQWTRKAKEDIRLPASPGQVQFSTYLDNICASN
jgi:hypothetical protein